MDLEDILIAVILDCKPKFYLVEREVVFYAPFVEPNSAVALNIGLFGHPAHADVAMDVYVVSIIVVGVFEEVWVDEYVGS